MTLPVSGNSISLSQVNVELSKSATSLITMNDSNVRTLAGVGGSGTTISMSNLLGKSAIVRTYSVYYEWSYTAGERGHDNNTYSYLVPTPYTGVYINGAQLYNMQCSRDYNGAGVNSTYVNIGLGLIGTYSKNFFNSISGNGLTYLTSDPACNSFTIQPGFIGPVTVWSWTFNFGGPGQCTFLPTPQYSSVYPGGGSYTTITYT